MNSNDDDSNNRAHTYIAINMCQELFSVFYIRQTNNCIRKQNVSDCDDIKDM